MKCDDLGPLMGAYLDSELDTRTAAEIAVHLDMCPDCAIAFAAARRDHERIAAFLQSPPSADSAALWTEIENRVFSSAHPRPTLWRVFAAAAAVVLLAAVASWQPWRGNPGASLVASMERDHREFLAGEFGPAFNGAPPPEVLAAAHGRVDAPAFAALPIGDGFTIEGSRLCHLSGVPVAWTLVRYQGHPVSWVAIRRAELANFPDVRDALLAAGRAVVVLRAGDYQFTARNVGDHVVCALGDLPADTLKTLLGTVPAVVPG